MAPSRAKKLAGAVALAGVAIGIHIFLPPVSPSKLAWLSAGTSRGDVERILGPPTDVLKASVLGAEAWRYHVPLRFGWVDVFFDEQGRVLEHNYERF